MNLLESSNKNIARRASQLALGIGAAALLAVAPQIARADAPAATSVDLESVTVTPESITEIGAEPGLVRLVFVDTNAVAARDVVFQVIGASGAVLQQIDDRGTFSPGIHITHSFMVPGIEDRDVVQVAAVKYSDGSTWIAKGAYILSPDQESVRETGHTLDSLAGR
jgi:hypothetical protein